MTDWETIRQRMQGQFTPDSYRALVLTWSDNETFATASTEIAYGETGLLNPNITEDTFAEQIEQMGMQQFHTCNTKDIYDLLSGNVLTSSEITEKYENQLDIYYMIILTYFLGCRDLERKEGGLIYALTEQEEYETPIKRYWADCGYDVDDAGTCDPATRADIIEIQRFVYTFLIGDDKAILTALDKPWPTEGTGRGNSEDDESQKRQKRMETRISLIAQKLESPSTNCTGPESVPPNLYLRSDAGEDHLGVWSGVDETAKTDVTDETSEQERRQRIGDELRELYRTHAPDKMDGVERLLNKYSPDRWDTLLTIANNKYRQTSRELHILARPQLPAEGLIDASDSAADLVGAAPLEPEVLAPIVGVMPPQELPPDIAGQQPVEEEEEEEEEAPAAPAVNETPLPVVLTEPEPEPEPEPEQVPAPVAETLEELLDTAGVEPETEEDDTAGVEPETEEDDTGVVEPVTGRLAKADERQRIVMDTDRVQNIKRILAARSELRYIMSEEADTQAIAIAVDNMQPAEPGIPLDEEQQISLKANIKMTGMIEQSGLVQLLEDAQSEFFSSQEPEPDVIEGGGAALSKHSRPVNISGVTTSVKNGGGKFEELVVKIVREIDSGNIQGTIELIKNAGISRRLTRKKPKPKKKKSPPKKKGTPGTKPYPRRRRIPSPRRRRSRSRPRPRPRRISISRSID